MKVWVYRVLWVSMAAAVCFTLSAAWWGNRELGSASIQAETKTSIVSQEKTPKSWPPLTEDEAMSLAGRTKIAQDFFERIRPTRNVIMIDGGNENGYFVYVGERHETHFVRAMTLYVSRERKIYEVDLVTDELRLVE